MNLWSIKRTSRPLKCLFTQNLIFQASPRGLNTKNGYISNFYEKLANDFIVQNDNFRNFFYACSQKKSIFEAIPRDLITKNGYIANFYEKLVNDFIDQNDNFRTIFMPVLEKQ